MKNNSINSQVFFNVLSKTIKVILSTVTLKIFTKMLGAEQYGLYSLFGSWTAILLPIICIEIGSSLSIARFDFKDDYSSYKKSILVLGTITSLFFIVLGLIFINPIASFLGYSYDIVIILLIYTFSTFITGFVNTIFIHQKKAKENFFISLFIDLSGIVLSYYLIKYSLFDMSYKGRIYGHAIPYLICGIVFWIIIFIKNKGCIKIKYWKYALAYGFPIVLHVLSHDALSQSNKILLQNMGYAGESIGIYSFYQTLVSVLSTLCMAFNTSWIPFYYDFLDDNSVNLLKEKSKNYIELFTVLTVGFVLLSREVSFMFSTEEFWSGVDVIPFLVLSIYFMFMYLFPVNFEYYCKKTKMIPIGTVCSGITNIVFNIILIPKYGFYGSSVATIISYLVLFIAHYIISRNIKEKDFNLRIKNYLPGLLMVFISIVIFYLLKDLWIIRWIIAAIIGIYEIIVIYKRKSIF